jgi:hypothetical protein
MKIETTPYPICSKCGSSRIALTEIKDCKCTCKANIHYDKICLECGFKSMIHRSVFNTTGTKGYIGE